MKKYLFTILLVITSTFSFAQSEKAKALVSEGITLHDKGDYEAALKKYDEAIAEDPSSITAYYEKTFTLYAMKRLEECIEISKKVIQQFPDNDLLKGVYVQYGSSLDDLGKSEDAIKVYNEGLKKFPNYFLLNFNKGITYTIMNDMEKAYSSYQDALSNNPFHASSYYRVTTLLKSTNHIPAMLAGIMYLVIEPTSARAPETFKTVKELMYNGVKKTDEKNTTITMDASMFDTKKTKKEPDNFRMSEMMFLMSSALDKDSVMNTITKTDIEKFDLKLQLLINSLETSGKGFFIERYVPFFKKLKENNYTDIVSRLVFANTNDEHNAAWLKINTDKVTDFYNWLKTYTWPIK